MHTNKVLSATYYSQNYASIIYQGLSIYIHPLPTLKLPTVTAYLYTINYSPLSAYTRRQLLDQQPQELQMMWSLTPNQRRYNRGSCEGWREGEEEEKGRREGSREGGGGDRDRFFSSMRERKREREGERGRGRVRGREKTHCFFHLLPSGGTRACLPG